ncbi:MAG: hypothetical protein COA32_13285 [Fluviicola sp.]|nr:MAG: hypothetical protein COA32_13285 [Fluviicola sp.]
MKLIAKLRESTRDQHAQLDQISEMKRLTSTDVEIKDYKNYLRAFLKIYSTIESEIYNYTSAYIKEINLNQRLPQLKNDLEQLKVGQPPMEVDKKLILNHKEYLGALYVMEGSRLGGNLIGKHLSSHLSMDENNLSFLISPPTVKWSQIILLLNEQPEENHVEVIKGAQKVFKYFYDELSDFYKEIE